MFYFSETTGYQLVFIMTGNKETNWQDYMELMAPADSPSLFHGSVVVDVTTVTTIHATANIWIQGRHQHDMRVCTDTFIDKKYHIQTRVQNTSVFIITGKEETQRHGAMEFTNIADSPGLVIGRKVDVTTVTTTGVSAITWIKPFFVTLLL